MKKYIGVLFFVLGVSLTLLSPKSSQAHASFSVNFGFPAPVYAYSEPVYVPAAPVYVVHHRPRHRYLEYEDDNYNYNNGVYVQYNNFRHRDHCDHHRRGWDD